MIAAGQNLKRLIKKKQAELLEGLADSFLFDYMVKKPSIHRFQP